MKTGHVPAERIEKAYQQGKRDAAGGRWPMSKSRYRDANQDNAWIRGFLEVKSGRKEEESLAV